MNRQNPILKQMLILLTFLLAVLAFVGCKTVQPITNTVEIIRTEKEIVRDTIIKTKPDSATVRALLECDSLNNVVLKEIETLQGNSIKPTAQIVHNEDGTLNVQVDCKQDSLEHEIQVRDRIIEELRTEQQQVPVQVSDKNAFLENSGIALWVLIAIAIIAAIVGIVLRFARR